MEMWLIYNDDFMAKNFGPITTHFVQPDRHEDMLLHKDVCLAQGAFEYDIPYATRVEWYSETEVNGVKHFKFRGFWTANKTREEVLISKYGSLDNI